MNDLELVLEGLFGWRRRERFKIVEENKIPFEGGVDHCGDLGERFGEASAHDQETDGRVWCHLEIDGGAVTGSVVLGEELGIDFGERRKVWTLAGACGIHGRINGLLTPGREPAVAARVRVKHASAGSGPGR